MTDNKKIFALGIDLGTSGVKAAIYKNDGTKVSSATVEYPLLQPKNGYAEQNPSDWWNGTVKAVQKALSGADINPSELCGIGLSGQMHGLVILDGEGEPLRPAILWCDGRTAAERDIIEERVGADKLLSITANPAIASFTAAKLLWVERNEPQIYQKIKHVLLPKDYIRYKLCGVFATEVSDASGTQWLDIKNRCWSKEVLSILNVPEEWLPKMYESPEITGTITAQTAQATGLPVGLPVAGGGGDNACAAVGTGVVEDSKAFTTIGTSGVLFAHTSEMRLDPGGRVHTFCCAVPGEWHVMGVTQAAGLSVQWLRNTLCTEEAAEADKRGIDSYALLDELAETAPIGANHLLYLPYLMGERTPHLDPNARGVFFGLSAIHTKADMIRAVLEGVSYSLKDCQTILEAMGVKTTDMTACGGGAKSGFWRQMLADLYECPVKLLQSNEGAALGAAILAFVGTGVYTTVPAACGAMLKSGGAQEPDKERSSRYAEFYELYQSLYPALKDSFAKLSRI